MMNLKVGVMPGKLQEVVVESGTTARQIFNIAEVSVSNHEIRLDGSVINIDDCVHNGKLLVAMKQIKGNVGTIKVGIMPGKLQEVEVTGTETASELFDKAGITIDRHEVRLDGRVINLSDEVENGKLLVAMKQIKGNTEIYTTSLEEDEIMHLLTCKLPQVLDRSRVEELGDDMLIIDETYLVEKDIFFSVYEEGYMHEDEVCGEVKEIEEEHTCECKNIMEKVEAKIEEIEGELDLYEEIVARKRAELNVLKDLLK